MELGSEMRGLLRKISNQSKDENLTIQQLNICKNTEVESISMCIALCYEFLCNYKRQDFFKRFSNTRGHFYSCLKVSMLYLENSHEQSTSYYFQNNEITEFQRAKEQRENTNLLVTSVEIQLVNKKLIVNKTRYFLTCYL